MDITVQYTLWYIYMGEFYLRFAVFYFQLLRFSVFVIIKPLLNSIIMATTTEIRRINPIICSHFVEYGYHFPIEILIYVYWWILVQIYSFIFPIINDIGMPMNWNRVCWWGVTIIVLIKGLMMGGVILIDNNWVLY